MTLGRDWWRAVRMQARVRRPLTHVLVFGSLGGYVALEASLSADPLIEVVVMLGAYTLALSMIRHWDTAGGVFYLQPAVAFSCQAPGCDLLWSHTDKHRVIAYANRHLAEVHGVEAPNWGPAPGDGDDG